MKQQIKERFTSNILNQIAERYDISPDNITELNGFESFIFEYAHEDQDYILRVGHSHRRSPEMIQAEVNWINYLADQGGAVSKAVNSKYGELVESVADDHGEHFLATSFEKAKGKIVWGAEEWTSSLFERYGSEIARLHSISKSYPLQIPPYKRYEWDDQEMTDMDDWLPESENDVLQTFKNLIQEINKFPKTKNNYGLIHQDAHAGNFFVDKNMNFTFFDFDDCAYSWYANDIAIVFFYAFSMKPMDQDYQKDFANNFIDGYRQNNDFPLEWLDQIPLFLKLREIELYGVIHRDFDVNNLQGDKWVEWFMTGRKERILNNVPVCDLDFAKVV